MLHRAMNWGVKGACIGVSLGMLSGCYGLTKPQFEMVQEIPDKIDRLTIKDKQLQDDVNHLSQSVDELKETVASKQMIDDQMLTVEGVAMPMTMPLPLATAPYGEAISEPSVKLVFQNSMLFEEGTTRISKQGEEILAGVAEKIKNNMDENTQIRIVGHADSLPLSGLLKLRYMDNWELSSARAAAVIRHFIWQHNIDPTKMFIESWGEMRPVAPNETEEGRAENRRIEIFIEKV
ncbi:MAG: OmpA family protein [Zetaproteobacteria bacterium]|nr:OmpA family protein [Zetaproteobacteria bacterium]